VGTGKKDAGFVVAQWLVGAERAVDRAVKRARFIVPLLSGTRREACYWLLVAERDHRVDAHGAARGNGRSR
jgi:hypothetical protein